MFPKYEGIFFHLFSVQRLKWTDFFQLDVYFLQFVASDPKPDDESEVVDRIAEFLGFHYCIAEEVYSITLYVFFLRLEFKW